MIDSDDDDEDIIKGLPNKLVGARVKNNLVDDNEGSPIDIEEEELYEDEYHLAKAVADKRKRL
jgi:hypothetical protein